MKELRFSERLDKLIDKAEGGLSEIEIARVLRQKAALIVGASAIGGTPVGDLANLLNMSPPISCGEGIFIQIDGDCDGFVATRTVPCEDVLREAAETFDAYARNHLAKEPPQIDKAERNLYMAEKCYATLGEVYVAPESVLLAPREPQDSDSAAPGGDEAPERIINAVAAIRDILADEDTLDGSPDERGRALEQIDQLLCKVMLVTDKDIPAYIRTKAGVADGSLKGATGQKDSHVARVLNNLAEELEKGVHIGLEEEEKALREIIQRIGEGNVAAGWWTDANIDLRDCPYTLHVVAGKLMLVCSEVSEAMEGWRKSQKANSILMDDKLPDRPMFEVEIADAVIRLFDLSANARFPGGRQLDVPGAIIAKLAYNKTRKDHRPENREKAGGKAS